MLNYLILVNHLNFQINKLKKFLQQNKKTKNFNKKKIQNIQQL